MEGAGEQRIAHLHLTGSVLHAGVRCAVNWSEHEQCGTVTEIPDGRIGETLAKPRA